MRRPIKRSIGTACGRCKECKYGVGGKLLKLCRVSMELAGHVSGWEWMLVSGFGLIVGLRQGCVMSPCLFNRYPGNRENHVVMAT